MTWISSAAVRMNGLGQRALVGPSKTLPTMQDVARQSSDSSPFAESARLSAQRQPVRRALVICLLHDGCPVAIVRRVALLVVSAFDGVCRRWARPHVTVERLERMAPRNADGQAAPTVIMKPFRLWRVAALVEAGPDSKFRRMAHAVRSARAWALRTHASARLTTSAGKVRHYQSPDNSASTAAFNIALPWRLWWWGNAAQHRPFAEALAALWCRPFSRTRHNTQFYQMEMAR